MFALLLTLDTVTEETGATGIRKTNHDNTWHVEVIVFVFWGQQDKL